MKRILLFVYVCVISLTSAAQSVVVSSYFNALDPRDEWIELLVLTDNTDMRSWSIRDNNSSQTSWQTAVNFNNTAFWNNMRGGTIIMIWNRPIASDGITAHTTDVNKDDGYVELIANDATYFNGGTFGTSPTWAGNSLNFAAGGDVIQLRNSSGTHIQALGHITTTGADWNALASPKLNHNVGLANGDAIFVCPGSAAADYGTNAPQSGTTYTAKGASSTFGLPNTCASSATANASYWYSVREPQFASQTVAPSSVVPGNPGSISFSWTGATDPNPSDLTQGYIILRNTTNSFTDPADGTTYVAGNTIGTATVLAIVGSSLTTSYTDNTVMNGNSYYYRVYAFRYTTDNLNGNSYNSARGRAYTSTFVQVDYPTPLPIELLSFRASRDDQRSRIEWTTATETSNDYFSIERASVNGTFEEISRVSGAGNSNSPQHYLVYDEQPLRPVNYYRLCQVDFDGQRQCFVPQSVLFEDENQLSVAIQSITETEGWVWMQIEAGGEQEIVTDFYDITGRNLYSHTFQSSGGIHTVSIPVHEIPKGVYLVSVRGKNQQAVSRFVR